MKHSQMHKLMDKILKEVTMTRDSGQMIEEEDGILSRKETDASLQDVQQKIQHESGDLSLGRGRSTSYRVQPNGNLQEMRQKGSGIEKSQEMGKA